MLFNWKIILATALLFGVLASGVFLIYRQQMESLSIGYLDLAEEAKSQENWQLARTHLKRYLAQNPDDAAQRAELAEIIDNAAVTIAEKQHAVKQLLKAIGVCEFKEDLTQKVRLLRRRLAERQFEVASFSDAIDQIALAAENESDPKLTRLFALCRFHQNRLNIISDRWSNEAESVAPDWLKSLTQRHPIDLLEEALRQNPGDLQLSELLANSCLQPETKFDGSALANATEIELLAKAKATSEKMLSANSESRDAWVSHFEIMSHVDPESVSEVLEMARNKFPSDPNFQLMAGHYYLAKANGMNSNDPSLLDVLDKSEEIFQSVVNAKEVDFDLTLARGHIQFLRGEHDAATETWKTLLPHDSSATEVFPNVFISLIRLKRFDEARTVLLEMDRIIASNQLDRDATDEVSGRSAETFEARTRISKDLWATYHLSRNDHESAIPLLEFLVSTSSTESARNRAIALDRLGDAYMRSQQWDRVGTVYEQASDLIPNEPFFHSAAIHAWSNAGRYTQALSHLNAISNKSLQNWMSEADVILQLQASPSSDPKWWVDFDRAIESLTRMAAASDSQTTAPSTLGAATNGLSNVEVAVIIEHLTIRGNVLRASDAAQPDAIRDATAQLSELCRSQPHSLLLWRNTFNVLKSWRQLDTLDQLQQEFRVAHPENRESFPVRANRLAKEGKLAEARQTLLSGIADDTDPIAASLSIVFLLALCENQPQWLEAFDALLIWSETSLARSKRVADAAFLAIHFLRDEADSQSDAQNFDELRLHHIHTWSAAVQKNEAQIKKIEGEEGTEWKAIQAMRLLIVAEFDPHLDLQPVIEVTRSSEAHRPLWSTTHTLAGLLAARRKDVDGAIQSFQQAISLGEKRLTVFERLALLLYERGRKHEAITLINQYGAAAGRSEVLAAIAIQLPGKTSNERMAIAQAAIDTRPCDAMAWVLYGQTLESASGNVPSSERNAQLEQATHAFEQAAQLNGANEDLRVLKAECHFYLFSRRDEARLADLLTRLEGATKIDESERCLLMARIGHSLGKHSEAEAHFQQAMDSGGNRIEIGLMLGEHYLSSGQEERALEQFEELYRLYPNEFSVRKGLAVLLFRRGATENSGRINQILLDPKSANEVDDRRYLATLQLQRGTPADLEKAKILMEEIVIDPTLSTDNDSFHFALICERLSKPGVGNFVNDRERFKLNRLAGSHFRLVAQSAEPNPLHIESFIAFLLECNEIDEAIDQFNRLKSIAPNEYITALLGAKIKQAQRRPQEAIDALLEWQSVSLSQMEPDAPPQRTQAILLNTTLGLLQLGAYKEVDQRIEETSQTNPEIALDCLVLGCELTDLQARSHALGRLVEHTAKLPNDDGLMGIANVLLKHDFEPEPHKKAEVLLSQRNSKNTTNAKVHMVLGDLWLHRASIPQAIASYRHAIAIDPNNVVALNTLACLIAESNGETEESIALIARALNADSNDPNLLDSKGLLLMQQGKPC
jgi:Tfp pilus assembly protein PilF